MNTVTLRAFTFAEDKLVVENCNSILLYFSICRIAVKYY